MRMKTKERWDQLCRQATVETDPEQLKLINREIDRILADQKANLERRQRWTPSPQSASD